MSVISGLNKLSQTQIEIARPAKTNVLGNLQGSTNAVWELASGERAFGSDRLVYIPHDHCYIGKPIPRNTIWNYVGSSLNKTQLVVNNTDWFHPYKTSHSSGGVAHTTEGVGMPDIAVYVSPQMVQLEAFIQIVSSNQVKARFYNRETKTFSSEATLPTTFGSHVFTDLPVIEGQWNFFDIEFQSISSYADPILLQILLAETQSSSAPTSNGQYGIATLPKP